MKKVKIKNIEYLDEQHELYDLETQNHNFYANDILVHNSNMGVCYSNPDGFWVQSKENIITPEKDNAGCAFAAYQNKSEWIGIIHDLAVEHGIDLDENIISVYAEWAGGSIQGRSACSNMDKRAIIFAHFKVSPLDPQDNDVAEVARWLPTFISSHNPKAGIYNIKNFPSYEIEIDFNNALMSQNKMISLVEDVIEPNSPTGKVFGVDGNTGEGIVVAFIYKDCLHRFKVKGEKHSKSKVKTLKQVDEVQLQKIQEIAQQVTPAWRLEQMFELANDTINGGIPEMKNMGTFLKFVNRDIIKEESDIIQEAGLEPKQVFSKTSQIAKFWYIEQLNAEAGL